MKKLIRSVAIVLALAIIILLPSCSAAPSGSGGGGGSGSTKSPILQGFVPPLFVMGDVSNPVRINREETADLTWGTVENEGTTLSAVELSQLITLAQPRSEQYDILLVGSDGLASKISGDDLTGCNVAFSEQFAWECINFNHPISSRVKMLQKIIIISRDPSADPYAVGLLNFTPLFTTAGNLQLEALESTRRFEGRSEINSKEVTVYTPHLTIKATELVSAQENIAVVSRSGEIFYDRNIENARLEVLNNRLDYLDKDGKARMVDVVGLMSNSPGFSITETYKDAIHFVEWGDDVMIIELDGWGYNILSQAILDGHQPFIYQLDVQKALAVYPPISPVGLASMLTGQTPDVHGIHDRIEKQPAVPDMFEAMAKLGKTSIYVEGETSLIATSIPPILSPDLGGNKGTDDEVHKNALDAIAKSPNLLFVHFHGIDDVATQFGPLSDETMEKTKEVDQYVADLVSKWKGKVIVTADHGLHQDGAGGTHGRFERDDMVVPYVMLDGEG